MPIPFTLNELISVISLMQLTLDETTITFTDWATQHRERMPELLMLCTRLDALSDTLALAERNRYTIEPDRPDVCTLQLVTVDECLTCV
jgi:hypothetical protein